MSGSIPGAMASPSTDVSDRGRRASASARLWGVLALVASLGCGGRLELTAKSCAEGEDEACLRLEERCAQTEVDACLLAGRAFAWRGSREDLKRALAVNTAACNGGVAVACAKLGDVYGEGGVVPISGADAVAWLERACRLGDRIACFKRWWEYPSAGFPGRGDVSMWQQLCAGGDAARCVSLGYMYAKAEGVPLDLERALVLAQQACDAGTGEGCYFLARLLAGWHGHEPRPDQANQRFEQGCGLGEARACEALGDRLLGGARRDQALALLRRACEAQSPQACLRLLQAQKQAAGGLVTGARALLERACRGTGFGEALSCSELARRLRAEGAPEGEWKELFTQACDHGDKYACQEYWRTIDPGFAR